MPEHDVDLDSTDAICREFNTTPQHAQALLDQIEEESTPQHWIDLSEEPRTWPNDLSRAHVAAWSDWQNDWENSFTSGSVRQCCMEALRGGSPIATHWYSDDHRGYHPTIDQETYLTISAIMSAHSLDVRLIEALAPLVPPSRLSVYSIADLSPDEAITMEAQGTDSDAYSDLVARARVTADPVEVPLLLGRSIPHGRHIH